MTAPFSLAPDFPEPEFADWAALAQRALAGGDISALNATTYDGLVVKPLYTQSDAPRPSLGAMTRQRHPFLPWDMRQACVVSEAAIANQAALVDLQGGTSSVEFEFHDQATISSSDFSILINDILTDIATVSLDASPDPLAAAQALRAGVPDEARHCAKLDFNLDPWAQIMTAGPLTIKAALAFGKELAQELPKAHFWRADARVIHEGGGSDGQELAYLIACGIGYLRAGGEAGIDASDINRSLVFTMSVGPEVVMEVVKLKAARYLWARVLAACGGTGGMRLQGVTSSRMQTIADPWTNIVRVTCATFASAIGGADIITAKPYDHAIGGPGAQSSAQARRIARNTQLILQEESHLGQVGDPSQGAFAFDAMIRDLVDHAWALVQKIEADGGIEKALQNGLVQNWVQQTRSKREQDVARARAGLVGVSVFPDPKEPSFEVPTSMAAPKSPLSIAPMRLSEPFERLRAQSGAPIFLAAIGTLQQCAPRLGFARNLFEAGGLLVHGAETAHGDIQSVVHAFAQSGAALVCVCSTDAMYDIHASDLAGALKAAGAKCVWLAGKAQYSGVDRNIFKGVNLIEELTHALHVLELPS